MQRSLRSVVFSAAAAACLSWVAGTGFAQEATTASPGLVMSVDQARAAFISSGYQVDQPHTWDWTLPPFTAFRVYDPATGRVVLVTVYASQTAADAIRLQAQAHEQGLAAGGTLDPTIGPHLVTGFGPSMWNGNVALVESTTPVLERLNQMQTDRDNGVSTDASPGVLANTERPAIVVDLDFQEALTSGAANL